MSASSYSYCIKWPAVTLVLYSAQNNMIKHFQTIWLEHPLKFTMTLFLCCYSDWLYHLCRGVDNEPVRVRTLPQSIGCAKTFPGKNKLTTSNQVVCPLRLMDYNSYCYSCSCVGKILVATAGRRSGRKTCCGSEICNIQCFSIDLLISYCPYNFTVLIVTTWELS